MNQLISLATATELIQQGQPLIFAGAEPALGKLPAGNWVAGTIPYFMADQGGVQDHERVFVTTPPDATSAQIAVYTSDQLPMMVAEAPDNGYSIVIIPAGSVAHRRFAEESRNYEGIFLKPIVGWVSGVALADLGRITPKVFDGRTGRKIEDGAVALHVTLPAPRIASLEIVNIFEPEPGPVLRFSSTGFSAINCLIDGQPTKLADFLQKAGNTGSRPFIGDFAGAQINVSIQSINPATGEVQFYAPVFAEVDYRQAKPLPDYNQAFAQRLQSFDQTNVAFSCNCILNYLFGGLEGRKVGSLQGPITFGEIAYQLLNQTMVVLRIH